MSKILKRPMFRRGGEVGGGIMSGIQTRSNYNVGGIGSDAALMYRAQNSVPTPPIEVKSPNIGIPSIGLENRMGRYSKVLRSALAPASSISPVAKFLITGGLKGLSQTGGGSTLANLAKAFEGPTAQLFTDLETEGKQGQDIDLTAAQLAIKGEQEMEKAREPKTYESGSRAARFETLFKGAVEASKAAGAEAFDPTEASIRINKELDLQDVIPMVGGTYSNAEKAIINEAGVPAGTIFYHPIEKVMKRKIKTKAGTFDLVPI
jgi:hypothetical protein